MTVFSVSHECVQLGLRAGAIVFRDVCIADASTELRAEIATEVQTIRRQFVTSAEIRSIPELVGFREILKHVGVNSRRHAPTVQSLLQFALKRGAMPIVNNLVDAYNLVSVRAKCSLGAHDLDELSLPVHLRLLRGDESFTPLGNQESREIDRGDFGYVDGDQRVICWLDVLQAEHSKITAQTTNVLMIIEATSRHDDAEVEAVFDNCISTVHRHCGGTAEIVAFPA